MSSEPAVGVIFMFSVSAFVRENVEQLTSIDFHVLSYMSICKITDFFFSERMPFNWDFIEKLTVFCFMW